MAAPIFGVPLDALRSDGHLRRACLEFLEGERAYRIFTPNPEILLLAHDDPGYADILSSADLALPDGTGVAIVERLLTGRWVRRWPGVEIGASLLQLATERNAKVVFVGGMTDVVEQAASRWRAKLPELQLAVAGAGVGFDDDGRTVPEDAEAPLIEAIRDLAPSIVMVGIGAPKQERWIARHADAFPTARIMIGVGGAFDIWAGRLRRAPKAFRTLGLEWLWRLILEPRRLPRIFRATVVFPIRAWRERVR